MSYSLARNASTSLYEVHKDGCQHLATGGLENLGTIEGSSAADALATFEAANEGCLGKLGPCVQKEQS